MRSSATRVFATIWLALVSFQQARADRMPMLDEELVSRAVVILVGQVDRLHVEPDGNRGISVRADQVLKGVFGQQQVRVVCSPHVEERSPSPPLVEIGKRYFFFLSSPGPGIGLVDDYDGIWPASSGNLEKLRKLIEQDRELEGIFRQVSVAITFDKTVVEEGERPVMTLSISNRSDRPLRIRGKVLNDDGQLRLEGWMNLVFAEIRAGRAAESASLGGHHCWSTPELLVPPGKTLSWTAPFNWGDRGSRPGTYRLQWKVGKATSESVTYTVVRPGGATVPASPPAALSPSPTVEEREFNDPRATDSKREVHETGPVHHGDGPRPPARPDEPSYALPMLLGAIVLALAVLIAGLAVFGRRRAGK